jgi:hypothetical protein
MDKELKDIINKAKEVRLSAEDKAQVRENLVTFMNKEVESVRNDELVRHSNWHPKIWFSFARIPAMAVLSVFLVTGVSFAAEGSIPGDTLYPVKVNFNEEFQSLIAFSPESKAKFEIKRAERRLEEVGRLALHNKLETHWKGSLEVRLEKQIERASKHVAMLEEKGELRKAALINDRLEVVLSVHDQILTDLDTKKIATKKIKERVKKVAARREALEKKLLTAKVIDKLPEEKKTLIKKKITPKAIKVIKDVKAPKINKQNLKQREYNKAYIKLQQAKRATEKRILLKKTNQRLKSFRIKTKPTKLKDSISR